MRFFRPLAAACLLLPAVSFADPVTLNIPADPAPRLDAIGAKLDTIHTDLAAILAQMKAGVATSVTINGLGSVAASPSSGAGTTATTPAAGAAATTVTSAADIAAAAYFPADSALAKFPSPEDSRMVRRADGTIGGVPYLLTRNGAEHRLVGVTTATPSGYTVNGKAIQGAGVYNMAIERQGDVYIQLDGGQIQHFEPAMGAIYNAGALPDALTATSGSTTTDSAAASPAPALPAPYAVAGGSSGRVLALGKDCATFTACLGMTADGDTVDATGATVHEDIPLITKAILVKGGTYDCHDTKLAQGKGCLVNQVDVIYDGVTVTGAGITETSAGGTAGIRPAATSYVTIRNSTLSGNQNGVAGGGFPWVLEMTDTVLDGNGLGDGGTHNMYPSGGTVRVTMTRVTSRNPRGGHAVKIRAPIVAITDSDLSADETLIDLPNGTSTVATVTNTKLTKNPGAANHRIIGYGEEGASIGTAGMMIKGGTVTGGDNPFVMGVGTVTFDGTAIVGTKPTGQGVTLKGL